jgi:hypothetical protein
LDETLNKGDQDVMKAEMKSQAKSALTDMIIAYECGELSAEKTLELFSKLVKNGMAWTLQGHYGRQAENLIERGYLDRQGNILKHIEGEDEG